MCTWGRTMPHCLVCFFVANSPRSFEGCIRFVHVHVILVKDWFSLLWFIYSHLPPQVTSMHFQTWATGWKMRMKILYGNRAPCKKMQQDWKYSAKLYLKNFAWHRTRHRSQVLCWTPHRLISYSTCIYFDKVCRISDSRCMHALLFSTPFATANNTPPRSLSARAPVAWAEADLPSASPACGRLEVWWPDRTHRLRGKKPRLRSW